MAGYRSQGRPWVTFCIAALLAALVFFFISYLKDSYIFIAGFNNREFVGEVIFGVRGYCAEEAANVKPLCVNPADRNNYSFFNINEPWFMSSVSFTIMKWFGFTYLVDLITVSICILRALYTNFLPSIRLLHYILTISAAFLASFASILNFGFLIYLKRQTWDGGYLVIGPIGWLISGIIGWNLCGACLTGLRAYSSYRLGPTLDPLQAEDYDLPETALPQSRPTTRDPFNLDRLSRRDN